MILDEVLNIVNVGKMCQITMATEAKELPKIGSPRRPKPRT